MNNLNDVPRCIDPTCLAIEIQAGPRGRRHATAQEAMEAIKASASELRWRQIPRIETYPQDFQPPTDCVHVFGLAIDGELQFGVGYDAKGLIKYLIESRSGLWTVSEIPLEVTGRIETRPSIRLVFEKDDQRDEFMWFLSELHANKRVPGLIRTFACPIAIENG